MSNIEFNRLQSSVIQQNLRQVGIALDVRTYEFATLYADVLSGNFQLFTLQWTGGALADPDILRRVFHSARCRRPASTAGLPATRGSMRCSTRPASRDRRSERRALYGEVQRIVADEVPYISLWYKTNVAVAQRRSRGIHLTPAGRLHVPEGRVAASLRRRIGALAALLLMRRCAPVPSRP